MLLGKSKITAPAGAFDHQSQANVIAGLETQPGKAERALKCRAAHQVESTDADKGSAVRPIDPRRSGADQKQQHKCVHDDIEQEALLHRQWRQRQMIDSVSGYPADRLSKRANGEVNIGIGEEKPFACGNCQHPGRARVLCRANPRANFHVQGANTPVAQRQAVDDFSSAIGRTVVDQNEFEVGIFLL